MDEPNPSSDLVGRAVLDARGQRIGQLTSVYADADTDTALFAGVEISHLGRHRIVLIPLADATISPASVMVRCGKSLALSAPFVRRGHTLPAEAEPELFSHYDLTYRPARSAARRLARR